jgi:predicted metal-dependent hydrolase
MDAVPGTARRPEADLPLFAPAAAPWPSEVVVDGVVLRVEVHLRRNKHFYARLEGDTLVVKVPHGADRGRAREAILDLARRLLRRAVRRRAGKEVDLLALARRVAERFPVRPRVESAEFSTTQMSWWGRFHRGARRMEIAAVLRHMPPRILEAVVAHELAHDFHATHGPAFRATLRRACPDADRADAFLHGVAWLAASLDAIPPVERALLLRIPPGAEPPRLEGEATSPPEGARTGSTTRG